MKWIQRFQKKWERVFRAVKTFNRFIYILKLRTVQIKKRISHLEDKALFITKKLDAIERMIPKSQSLQLISPKNEEIRLSNVYFQRITVVVFVVLLMMGISVKVFTYEDKNGMIDRKGKPLDKKEVSLGSSWETGISKWIINNMNGKYNEDENNTEEHLKKSQEKELEALAKNSDLKEKVLTEKEMKEDILANKEKEEKKTEDLVFIPTESNLKWLNSAKHNSYINKNIETENGYKYYVTDKRANSAVGIDVSVYQGNIDWKAVKKAGVDFAMIRVGFRGYENGDLVIDSKYLQNVNGAQKAGIKIGIYFFSQAINEKEALQEAELTLKYIKGHKITYPVAIDTEYVPDQNARTNLAHLSNKDRTDICLRFCDRIKEAGYIPAVYACRNWLLNALQVSRLDGYDIWYARYGDTPGYKYQFSMWQFSDKGKVPGISPKVDLNISFKNYGNSIKNSDYNQKMQKEYDKKRQEVKEKRQKEERLREEREKKIKEERERKQREDLENQKNQEKENKNDNGETTSHTLRPDPTFIPKPTNSPTTLQTSTPETSYTITPEPTWYN